MQLAYGRISEVMADKGLYRVSFEDREAVSKPLPRVSLFTLENKHVAHFDTNEHVAVIMDENFENGIILGAFYDKKNTPPGGHPDKIRTEYKDGSFTEFNRATSKLTVSCEGDIEVIKSTNTKITASQKIQLTPGTVIELAGAADNAVRYTALDTALQAAVTATNVELGKISAVLNALIPSSYVVVPVTLNITAAKVNEVKTS